MRKRISAYILVIVIVSFISCKGQESKKTEMNQIPKSFEILNETEGDLDKDSVSEKVVVYDTAKETDFGTERQLFIYKKINDEWELWKKATGAILASKEGGMMGDPFEGISIERNCIVINHFGGSNQKWSYTHRFRFQHDEFQLIGATVQYDAPCDYFVNFDYNLSNGKIVYKKEVEDCETESSKVEKQDLNIKLETLPSMNGFQPGTNELKLPESEITMYY